MKDIIYLINGDENRYKIGITSEKRLSGRVKQLQTGASCELRLVFSYNTKYASIIEKVLHRELEHKRLVGEWFELTNEDVFTFKERCSTIEKNLKLLKDAENPFITKIIK